MNDPQANKSRTALPQAEIRPPACDPNAISFYVTASDQDLLRQLKAHMHQTGMVGVSDTAGRLHYIVDGTRGTPYAGRRILEMASRRYSERSSQAGGQERLLPEAVERVLDRFAIRHELKGRAYLQHILLLAAQDERQLRPLSKSLYPEVAGYFKASSYHVERDLRYVFSCADKTSIWPAHVGSGNTARITFLTAEVKREMRRLEMAGWMPTAADSTGRPVDFRQEAVSPAIAAEIEGNHAASADAASTRAAAAHASAVHTADAHTPVADAALAAAAGIVADAAASARPAVLPS